MVFRAHRIVGSNETDLTRSTHSRRMARVQRWGAAWGLAVDPFASMTTCLIPTAALCPNWVRGTKPRRHGSCRGPWSLPPSSTCPWFGCRTSSASSSVVVVELSSFDASTAGRRLPFWWRRVRFSPPLKHAAAHAIRRSSCCTALRRATPSRNSPSATRITSCSEQIEIGRKA